MTKRNLRLRSFLALFCMGTLLFLVGTEWLVYYRASNLIANKLQDDTIQLLQKNIVSMLSFSVATRDKERIDETIKEITTIDFVYYVEVLSPERELISRAVNKNIPVEKGIPITTIEIPLYITAFKEFNASNSNHQDALIGRVELAVSPYKSDSMLKQVMIQTTIATIAAISIVGFLIAFLIMRFQGYVTSLIKTLDDISKHKFTKIEENNRFLELEKISKSVNHLSSSLSSKTQSLESSNEYKNMILNVISHELRQPLNALDPILQLLISTPQKLDQRALENLRICASASNHLTKILDRVVEFSLISKENIPVRLNTLCINEVINEVCAIHQPESKRRLYLKVLEQHERITIQTDEPRLRGILSNLISNAVKFTERGHVIVEWELKAQTDTTGILTIKVEDTGCGIAEENIKKVFSDYYRENNKIPGLGIGLSLVQSFSKDLEGHVSLDSRPGLGTNVEVTIPVIIVNEQSPRNRDIKMFQSIKALILDDHEGSCLALRKVLESYGVECYVFQNPYEAIEEVYEQDYQVVFVDYWMPQMTGIDFSRKISDLNIHIVCLTAHVETNVISQIEEAPYINQYLRKPLSIEDIENILSAITESNNIVNKIISDIKDL